MLAFDSLDGAHSARKKLVELDNQYLLKLDQAVEVIRKEDGHVKIKEESSITGAAALGGAFWGFLIGLIFLIPGMGAAVGAATGAIAGHFAKYGITREYMDKINEAIKPGQSALVILADNVKLDRVLPMLSSFKARVIRTSLSFEQEKALRDAFGASPAA